MTRLSRTPATVEDQHDRSTATARVMAWLAVTITRGVGTMWCALIFAAIAMVSLPAAIKSGDPVVIVQWLSSVFLQLTLLSILAVGQNVLAKAADQRAKDTYDDTERLLLEIAVLQAAVKKQGEQINKIWGRVV